MTIEFELQDVAAGQAVPSKEEFQAWIGAVLEGRDDAGLVIRVVGEDEMRALNARYRGRDKVTNVLSFPAELPAALKGRVKPEPLGDIVICAPIVAAEAGRQEKPLLNHWAHLTVHGLLHLLGYDHEEEAQAQAMEAREIAILSGIGIPDPYDR